MSLYHCTIGTSVQVWVACLQNFEIFYPPGLFMQEHRHLCFKGLQSYVLAIPQLAHC